MVVSLFIVHPPNPLSLFLSLPLPPAGKRRYLILRKGCLYYFANETASAPKGQFILTGYK